MNDEIRDFKKEQKEHEEWLKKIENDHRKDNIKEEIYSSDTYHNVLDHRGNCDKWHKTKCLECFGGGLASFVSNLLREKKFVKEIVHQIKDLFDGDSIFSKKTNEKVKEAKKQMNLSSFMSNDEFINHVITVLFELSKEDGFGIRKTVGNSVDTINIPGDYTDNSALICTLCHCEIKKGEKFIMDCISEAVEKNDLIDLSRSQVITVYHKSCSPFIFFYEDEESEGEIKT